MQKLWNLIFGSRSVEKIVAPITKIVDELRDHADLRIADKDYHDGKSSLHDELALAADAEAKKALAAASQIGKLISGSPPAGKAA
jgi:hypothetical protein